MFNNDIKCFYMGFNTGSFMGGMKYFSDNFNKSLHNPITNIDWLGMDLNDRLHENGINGFTCNDLLVYSNLNHCKYSIENKFNTVELIINNIKPNIKNNKTLISASILSLTVLRKNGALLTKILSPDYWDGSFLHYILLFAMLFHKIKIIRYPVCKHKHIYYEYYLLCCCIKPIEHNFTVYRKLVMLLKNNETNKMVFLQSIIDNDSIKDFKINILNIRDLFIKNNSQQFNNNAECELNVLINNFNTDN